MKNFNIFEIKYLGATNTKGSRIRIYSPRFKEKIIIDYDYNFNTIYDKAADYLTNKGFNIIGTGEGVDKMYLISDSFKPLK